MVWFMNKNIWIIANWKAHKTINEALEWVNKVGPEIPKDSLPAGRLKVVVCPTFSALSEIKKAIRVGGFPILVGSQDISPFGIGAYTGEEPAEILKQFIDLSIIGHSERRYNFSETDQLVKKKVTQALGAGIIPLVCVQSEDTPVPDNCPIIAYEPTSAISTGLSNTPGIGRADNPDSANAVASHFKHKYLTNIEVIYGGSVDSKNVKGFIAKEDISGVLVGNASLDPDEFIKIIEEATIESSKV